MNEENALLNTTLKYTDRTPEQIITESVYFDSSGYVFRALSWLDIAKKSYNVCALQYASIDTRQSIEHLLFEAVVLSAGTQLDRQDYEKCRGNSTKLHKIIRRLNPDYEKLIQFTRDVHSPDPDAPPILEWDQKRILRYWGEASTYLHWPGEPKETVESIAWVKVGISAVGNAAEYIWKNKTSGFSGIMMPENMQPEVRSLWERFKKGEIDSEAVKRTANLALPILKKR